MLGPFELGPTVAGEVARRIGRPVTVGGLRVEVGTVVRVELQDLVVANLPDASADPFLKIARLDAEIAPWSLLEWAVLDNGPTIHRLSIEGAALLLEHGTGGRPNWRFGEGEPAARAGWRPRIPVLLDARLHDLTIDLRTSSGNTLDIRLDDTTVATGGADQPITLAAIGAYNGAPVQLSASLDSFEQLHKTAAPFGTDAHLVSGETVMSFVGAATKPLEADGVTGRVGLKTPTLDRLLAVSGIGGQATIPVTLAASLSRTGGLWHLTEGKGTVSGQPFQLDVQLREGVRHAPDDFVLDAVFTVLDLTGVAGQENIGKASLRIDDAPGNLLDAHVTAKEVVDGELRAENLEFKAKLAPGTLSVAPLTMRFAGGGVRIDAASNNAESGSAVRVDASLSGADPAQLLRVVGLGPLPIAGPVDISANLRATGDTPRQALRSGSGGLVLSMQSGTVARNLVEQASTDMRLLFRKTDGVGQIACMLGLIDFDNGLGRLAPLRLRTSDGTIVGSGTIDLRRDTVDLIVGTESASTSVFALDVPVHISGPLMSPQLLPAVGRSATAGTTLGGLPPALQDFARRNPCISIAR